jgi:hypothetical protein
VTGAPGPARTGVPGGVGLRVEEYLEFLGKEYLGDYVRSGGAAVRLVVVGAEEVATRWHEGLSATAGAYGFTHVGLDAASTRIHLMHEVFLAVSRRLDWSATARFAVRAAYDRLGLPAPEGELSVPEVAAYHEIDVRELGRSLRRSLEADILGDVSLAHEFRVAMLRLCQAETTSFEVDAAERAAVVGWLRGEPVPLGRLRAARLFSRVGRHNARPLLQSMASWLARTGNAGLVLDLDLTRLAVARRPPAEARHGVYYSKAAVLDAYEMIRQLIDATDTLRCLLVTATLPPELVTDDGRGLPAYAALQLRVADEVRDRRRANPFAALVRLETRVEAVP